MSLPPHPHPLLLHIKSLLPITGVTNEQLGGAYVAATTASVFTALGFNRLIASRPALAAGIVGRLVPLAAVAAANCVNIPLMVSTTFFSLSSPYNRSI